VTALAGDGASFWTGTSDRGVYHWQAGTLAHFGEPEGLPDPNVTSILDGRRATYVGGPMGIAEFREGRLYRTLARGFFTSALAIEGDTLLAGSLEEGIAADPAGTSRAPPGPPIDRPADGRDSAAGQACPARSSP
jgi:hypothetical protein